MRTVTNKIYEHTSLVKTEYYRFGPVDIFGNHFYFDNIGFRNIIVNELLGRQLDICNDIGITAKYDKNWMLVQKLKFEKHLGGKNTGSKISGSFSKRELEGIVARLTQN